MKPTKKPVKFKKQEGQTIIVNEKSRSRFIEIHNVNFITCKNEISYIHLYDTGEIITISKLLKKFENELRDYGFVKAHHNTLVNLAKVKEFRNKDGGQLVMKNDEIVQVSTRKRPGIRHCCNLKNVSFKYYPHYSSAFGFLPCSLQPNKIHKSLILCQCEKKQMNTKKIEEL